MTAKRTVRQDCWLQLFNRILYPLMPGVYNAMDALTLGAWWRLVSQALDYVPPDKKVLEIGFGPGRLHVALAHRARFCSGLDMARGMCTFTRRRLARKQAKSLIVQGNVFKLPYPDESFDYVVSTFAFSGWPEGEAAMREVSRVIAKGGRFVLIDIGLPPDRNRTGTFFARLWEKMGDFLYDQARLMASSGLIVEEKR
nr:class I SAM-dependent methyltransferase [Anaerolineae bacterium]